MQLVNTPARYGAVAQTFHWTVALLILTNLALGLVADWLPQDTGPQIARKAVAFQIHKSIGLAVLALAVLRIAWALTQPKPRPMHPERTLETFAAEAAHWTLYIAIVAVPLSGWVTHAASTGFAPIPWPFGQGLPLVPKSTAVEHWASVTHWVFVALLALTLAAHVGGALKHALVDRDGTLRRMWFGITHGAHAPRGAGHGPLGPALMAAVAAYTVAAVAIVGLAAPSSTAVAPKPAQTAEAPQAADATQAAQAGAWTVQEGSLDIGIRQMGSQVDGGFASWSADIDFDEETGTGSVRVEIDVSSLSLGSVTKQALGPDYFAADEHPRAVFQAQIAPSGEAYAATGTLDLAGESAEVTLPFTLQIDGDTARMEGQVTLDRRNYGIGAQNNDPNSLGFEVEADIALTATRAP